MVRTRPNIDPAVSERFRDSIFSVARSVGSAFGVLVCNDPVETTLTRQLPLKLGVPAEAIVEFGDRLSSAYEEARAILEWAKSSGAKKRDHSDRVVSSSTRALDIPA